MPSLFDRYSALLGGGGVSPSYDTIDQPIADESLLSRIGGSALSGLGWLAEVLQKPDRVLYAIPSGNFRELLNLIPFSDTAGLTDPSHMASASTALENLGVIPENTPGFDWWDPLRFTADVVGSPSFYSTFGGSALTKAGGVAEAAGLLDGVSRVGRMTGSLRGLINSKNLGDVVNAASAKGVELGKILDEPLQGIARFGIPGTGIGKTVGFGPISQKIAGTLDTAGQLIGRTPIIGPTLDKTRRGMRMLFDPSVRNTYRAQEQELASLAYRNLPEGAARADAAKFDAIADAAEVRKAFTDAFGDDVLSSLGVPFRASDGAFGRGTVVQAHDRGNFGHVVSSTPDMAAVHFVNPETGARKTVDLPVSGISQVNAETAKAVNDKLVSEVFDRLVRFSANTNGDIGAAWEKVMGQAAASPDDALAGQIVELGRKMQEANRAIRDRLTSKGFDIPLMEELHDSAHFPRYVDREIAKDFSNLRGQRLASTSHPSAMARTPEIRHLPDEIVNDLLLDPKARGDGAADHIFSRYRRWLGGYEGGEQKHAEDLAAWVSKHQSRKLFTRQTVDDFGDYQRYGEIADANMDAIHEMVSRTMSGKGDVALDRAFKDAGLKPVSAMHYLASKTGFEINELAAMKLPADVADALTAVIRPYRDPEWRQILDQTVGRFNKWFRRNVTLPFPGFANRNFLSGQHVNIAASGVIHSAGDVADYAKAFREAASILRNPGENRELIRELFSRGLIGREVGFEGVETMARGAVDALTPKSPFGMSQTWAQAGIDVANEPSIIPGLDKIPGAKFLRRIGKTWMGTGEKLNQNVEMLNRVPMYLYLKRKGWSAGAAMKKVNELQFDYRDFTAFEQGIRNSIVPFYAFQRKAAPLLFRNVIERPGGGVAQSIRAATFARGDRDQAATVPDYVSQTTSIPLGAADDGTKRFLTGFGLAHEVPAQFLGGGFQDAGLEALSQLSPLVKTPLEWATGQSFFQRGVGGGGRPLADLDPTIGRTIANISDSVSGEKTGRLPDPGFGEFLLSNSPISRYLSTARQLADPRKGPLAKLTNFATGVRITDISPAAQEAVLRERASGLMEDLGARSFEKVYFSKEDLASMSETERLEAQGLNALQRLLARKASARARLTEAASR